MDLDLIIDQREENFVVELLVKSTVNIDFTFSIGLNYIFIIRKSCQMFLNRISDIK